MDPSRTRVLRLVAALVLTTSVLVGCGDDDGDADATTTTETPTTSGSPTTTSTPDGPVPDAELPGEAFDISPDAGDLIAVVGVRFDDVLNVRRTPGTDGEILAGLAPLADDAVATGRARMLTSSIWWEIVTADGVTGWVGSSFTAQIGPTSDTTAAVIAELGYRPEEATMSDLGLLVAETVDRDPDVPSDIVMSVEADETGDLREVTFDLIGLGDDSVRGVRLHVFGQPLESGDGFGLRSVEQTDLCDPVRGPSEPDGLCA